MTRPYDGLMWFALSVAPWLVLIGIALGTAWLVWILGRR